MRRGFELKAILAEISGVGPTRVELPAALDTGARYDFVLVPPHEEDTETINRPVRDGIAKHFQVSIASETRSMDADVITAVQGKTPRPKPEDEAMGGSFGTSWQAIAVPEAFRLPQGAKPTRKQAEEATKRMMESPEFRQAMAMAQLTTISAISSSMDDFRRALEDGLHRPVIDETGLDGYYDFKLAGEAHSTARVPQHVARTVGPRRDVRAPQHRNDRCSAVAIETAKPQEAHTSDCDEIPMKPNAVSRAKPSRIADDHECHCLCS